MVPKGFTTHTHSDVSFPVAAFTATVTAKDNRKWSRSDVDEEQLYATI